MLAGSSGIRQGIGTMRGSATGSPAAYSRARTAQSLQKLSPGRLRRRAFGKSLGVR